MSDRGEPQKRQQAEITRSKVEQLLVRAGIDPARVLVTPGKPIAPADSEIREAVLADAAAQAASGARLRLPKGAQWIAHDKRGGKAAQRRLRQMERGRIAPGKDHCSLCGEWVNGTLGGARDDKTGKFACNGCAAAYLGEMMK